MASDSDKNVYGYVPSNVAAGILAIIFIILTLAHFWRMVSTRQWFGIAIIIGGFCMFLSHLCPK